ncbi:MAG TPA: hypothetical protein VKD71_14165 [Gemmataceae bacterium]|nr:hypothetical protein [Gemmataceae bacterium]
MKCIRCRFVLFVLVVCDCAVSPNDEPTVQGSGGETPAEVSRIVEGILEADMTPEARMKALAPYVDVGRTLEEIEAVLGGFHSITGHGPGFFDADYWEFGRPGLRVGYYPDCEVCSVAYLTKDGKEVLLRSDGPTTWPRTDRAVRSW